MPCRGSRAPLRQALQPLPRTWERLRAGPRRFRDRPDLRACALPSAPLLAPLPAGLARDMVLSELAARLNCAEYKNWVKAGHCLLLLRDCLQGFVGREVLAFHRGLLAASRGLDPRATCLTVSRCIPRARQFQPQCQVCSEWKREILKHHTNRNGDIHWGNCRPGLWPVDAWEVAKVSTCGR